MGAVSNYIKSQQTKDLATHNHGKRKINKQTIRDESLSMETTTQLSLTFVPWNSYTLEPLLCVLGHLFILQVGS